MKNYARYVRLELARGRLPDGSTFVTEKSLLARRVPHVWYGMGLWIEDYKDVRVFSHGGSMFGYKSNFFFVPDAGVGGVILTNADSGGRVAAATIARTLELLYDGKPEAEGVPQGAAAELDGASGSVRSAAARGLVPERGAGEIVVQKGTDGVVFQFGGWKSRVGTRANPDGTTTFILVDPGIRGFEFNARAANGVYKRLKLGDAQHIYEYEAQDQGGSSR